MRAGQFIRQVEGYRAFVPAPLPPDPPPVLDAETINLMSRADRALGRLDGVTSILPNPDLFVAMFVRQEAVLSSQIEGTQSTLEDVLQFELDEKGADLPKDVGEVVNYVNAMNFGLGRLKDLPLCLKLIREIHERLLRGVRGGEKTPGDFRRSQNWIGPAGCTLATAAFVPPPVHQMHSALDNLEKFLHDDETFPVLIHCALAHAQFETIHPFIDGNGRVGRLLITFLLCQREILHRPLLYLSSFLKANRAEYYDRLTAIRQSGDWEGWIKFFLRGVFEVSQAATETARKILALREEHRQRVKHQALLDYLFEQPLVSIHMVQQRLGCGFPTAGKYVEQFAEAGILRETTGFQRNRRYRYDPYLSLFESPDFSPFTRPDVDEGDAQATETEAGHST
ncbi:Fic family protein [Paludisphaera borealis]|uniref:Adenosine monophosphate-protein transferase SoFic n=1 Tax=Paludisphaera borealis TaxID=1387353 RepID=A0A1U7CQH1_9BACT|nr:Fic family protein [Paludisphaera borealis]APW61123.1 Adenosine monophosphate-protein transferase SoFic [Paludisphaera borealis]